MLIEFGEIKQFLRNGLVVIARSRGPLRLVHLLQMGVLLVSLLQKIGQVSHAIMSFLFDTPYHAHERAAIAPEYDGGALVLMREQLLVRNDIGASLVGVTAPEHDFAEQIPCHPVDSIELGLVSAEGTCVGVLLEPVGLAISAKGLFTSFALDRVLEHVVTDATDQLWKECLDVVSVVDSFLLEDVFGVYFGFVDDALHNLNF